MNRPLTDKREDKVLRHLVLAGNMLSLLVAELAPEGELSERQREALWTWEAAIQRLRESR